MVQFQYRFGQIKAAKLLAEFAEAANEEDINELQSEFIIGLAD